MPQKLSRQRGILKDKKDYADYFLSFFIIFFLISIFLFFFFPKFIYAFYSLKLSCYYSYEQAVNNSAGYFSTTFNETTNETTTEIKIFEEENTTEYYKTLKHELIHEHQYKNNYSFDCDNKLGIYINELEAYFGQELNSYFFNKFYGDVTAC